jgi:transposase
VSKLPKRFCLDRSERKKIEERRRKERDTRLANRLSALLWLADGRSCEEVAQLLGVNPKTIKNWLKLYLRWGLEALCTLKYKGDRGELSSQQAQELKKEVEAGHFRCAAQAQKWIEDTFGVTYTVNGVRKLLNRLGCTYHKTSAFLFKANRDKQKAHVAEYEQDCQKVNEGWRRYFIDGVHPVWGMDVLFCCWLLRGQRFEVGVGGGRKRLNILGAFCPDDYEYLDRRYTTENLNAQSMIDLFQLMMERHPETKKFRLYLDNARYQHAKLMWEWIAKTKAEKGVVFDLKHLPPYSPNLNLIERLWKFLRKMALQTWHPTFEAMQDAVAKILDNLGDYKEELKTLMTERFHLVPEMPSLALGGQPK